jgi:hypothetical protein
VDKTVKLKRLMFVSFNNKKSALDTSDRLFEQRLNSYLKGNISF